MSNATTETQVPRNPKAVVEQLRSEAAKNPVFSAVAHLFVSRDRTRQQITLSNLRISMGREGFHYTKEEYTQVLKFMANLGLGRLDFDSENNIRALKDIKITLQSIGYAALGKEDKLVKFVPAPMFQELPVTKQVQKVIAPPAPKPEAPSYPTKLIVNIDGHEAIISLPKGLTTSELGLLLNALFVNKTPRV